MEKKLIIANWKSNKTIEEAKEFLEVFKNELPNLDLSNKEIVIAPSYTILSTLNYFIHQDNLPISLSAQNVSPFPEGAYTGEVAARGIKEVAEYVIIGHSERKRYLHESESEILNKVDEAKKAGLKVVMCIQNEDSPIYDKADIIAYEPPSAISTFGIGKPEEPEDIDKVLSKVAQKAVGKKLIYGGSVKKENIVQYSKIISCSGFLVGGASLDAHNFISLLLEW